jgi:hypothetical protein
MLSYHDIYPVIKSLPPSEAAKRIVKMLEESICLEQLSLPLLDENETIRCWVQSRTSPAHLYLVRIAKDGTVSCPCLRKANRPEEECHHERRVRAWLAFLRRAWALAEEDASSDDPDGALFQAYHAIRAPSEDVPESEIPPRAL